MEKSSKVYVGMDVHKESIEVTLAEQGGEVRRLGQIGGDRGSLLKMARKLQSRGGERVFVYEAGPCGFWIQRELAALGERCMVVSPALVPRRAGDHVKTDRRDSERLASLARAGELEAIHVPDIRDEAIRDLVRGRDDAVIAQRRVRQQLKALLLRNDIRYVGKTSWSGAHRRWLSELKLPEPAQQIVFEEYVDAIAVATGRIERLTRASQTLDRGSSATHSSHAATQRANISLIDRRSRWPRRVPYLALEHCHSLTVRCGQDQLAFVDNESHINVHDQWPRNSGRKPAVKWSAASCGWALRVVPTSRFPSAAVLV